MTSFIPNRIVVCGIPLDIKLADIGDDGEFVSSRRLINIDCNLPLTAQHESLAHEIWHAKLYYTGMDEVLKDKLDDECFTRIMENCEYTFLRDNTDFFQLPGNLC